jgi:hypothetical protein
MNFAIETTGLTKRYGSLTAVNKLNVNYPSLSEGASCFNDNACPYNYG